MKTWIAVLLVLAGFGLIGALSSIAQPPPLRRHTVNQAREPRLVEADRDLPFKSQITVSQQDGFRVIQVNNIPEHKVGRFPNDGNPHPIQQRPATFRVPLHPARNEGTTPVELGLNFGIGVNGVLFDPGAAEFWQGNPRSGWQYEALGGAVPLGLDTNYAHVQPDGKYHYHGLPTGLLRTLGVQGSAHSPIVGWAADGFPLYALYGHGRPGDAESAVRELHPSYRLKSGKRPGAPEEPSSPGGEYDGAFVNDYEFVAGLGDLDECNGRFCVTPEFPEGTYAYFLTHHWPCIPRMFRGTPDPSFRMGPPGGGRFGPPKGPRKPKRPRL
ncbi:MAG: YHYH protein [Pirellulaceae bacterium]